MSIHISPQQMQQWGEQHFERRLIHVVAQGDPAALQTLTAPEGRAQLRDQIRKARAYGLTTELEVSRYVITAWVMGLEFDTRLGAYREFLTAPQLTPAQKGEALERITRAVMEELNQGAAA